MKATALPESTARAAIQAVGPDLEPRFLLVVRLLNHCPSLQPTPRGWDSASSDVHQYLAHLANQFVAARAPRAPQKPQTIPDPVVGTVLNGFYGIAEERLPGIADTHLLSMAAENVVGDLLERYIAHVLEPHGWVWCSGSVVRSVDFLRPASPGTLPLLLQVKNRDNSENSSSGAIREGTSIEKWFRSFSRRPSTNWDAFPDADARRLLSEPAFGAFVRDYMQGLRPRP
jgi:hypothetical protein